MIVGKSLFFNRIYVDREDPNDAKVKALTEKGYEVVVLGGRPEALALKSDAGLCSGPTVYSARHCFGDPSEDVKGKEYVIVNADVKGRVVKDYSPFVKNIVNLVLYLLGKPNGVCDLVRVSTPLYIIQDQVAVVTGGVLGQTYGFLTILPQYEPEDLIDKEVEITVDVPEADEIRGRIFDYAVVVMWYKHMAWPTEVLVATVNKPLKPGNSGGPAALR
jgi:hypothetical protein